MKKNVFIIKLLTIIHLLCLTSVVNAQDLTNGLHGISEDTVYYDQRINAWTYIKNIDSTTAGESQVYYYMSKDSIFDILDYYVGYNQVSSLALNDSSYEKYYFDFPFQEDGSYYMLFVADQEKDVSETNEFNNVTAQKVVVQNSNTDLVFVHHSLDKDTVYASNKLKTTGYIKNIGTETNSNTAYVYFYLSKDTIFDSGDDYYLGSSYGGYISPNDSTYESGTYRTPVSYTGDSYILYIVDRDNNVNEHDENNNTGHLPVTILESNIDLSVGSTTYDDTITTGGKLSFSTYIKNTGATMSDYKKLGIYISTDSLYGPNDRYISNYSIEEINPGDSVNISYNRNTYNVDTGDFYLILNTNYNNYTPDINQANDTKAFNIHIRQSNSDLVMATDTLYPDTINTEGRLDYDFSVLNSGTEDAGFSYTGVFLSYDTVFDINDDKLRYWTDYSLTAGSSDDYSGYSNINTELATGEYYLLFVTDYTNNIIEPNENNNIRYQKFFFNGTTSALPDLTLIDSLTHMDKDTLVIGEQLTVNATVKNTGKANSDYFYNLFYISKDSVADYNNPYFHYDYVPPIDSGSVRSENKTFSDYDLSIIEPGLQYLVIRCDGYDYRLEENETNNTAILPIYFKSTLPDITLKHVTINDSTVKPGESINTNFYIKNIGDERIDETQTYFYLSTDTIYDDSDHHLNNVNINGINPGDSINKSYNISIPEKAPGQYYLIYRADHSGWRLEKNEQNNIHVLPITIELRDPVDLTAVDIQLNENVLFYNDTLDISLYVTNIDDSLSNSTNVYYYLSEDNTYDQYDIYISGDNTTSLAKNDSFYAEHRLALENIKTGNYFVVIRIDPYNSIKETNEDNNQFILPFRVVKPSAPLVTGASRCETGPVTITASGATDAAETYKWYDAARNYLAGEDSSSYTFIASGTTLLYVAIDSAGKTSDLVPVYATVDKMPSDSFEIIGGNMLSTIDKNKNYTYQWLLEGSEIFGATDDMYDASATGQGNYSMIITNGECLDTSGTQFVHALKPSPPSTTGDSICGMGDITLHASGASGPNEQYIWYDTNNIIIPGLDSASYTLNYSSESLDTFFVAIDSAGFYSDKIPVVAGAFTPPGIGFTNNNPWLIADFSGKHVRYQWVKDSISLAGETNDSLFAEPYGDGLYQLEITNGSCIDTSTATNVIIPRLDLTITSDSLSSNIFKPGTSVFYVYYSIKNIGNQGAVMQRTGFYLSDDDTWDEYDEYYTNNQHSVPQNDSTPGYIQNIASLLDGQYGDYYIIIRADMYNVQPEDNEDNNYTVHPITIEKPDNDIVNTSYSLSETTSSPGGTLTTYTYLKNEGTDNTINSGYVRYYLSKDQNYDAFDAYLDEDYFGHINAGDSTYEYQNITLPEVPTGGYYILFVADYDNTIAETNENNNVAAITIILNNSSVDIVVGQNYLSSDTVVQGQDLSGVCYPKNIGGEASTRHSYVYYYISTDTVYDILDLYLYRDYFGELEVNDSSGEDYTYNIRSLAEGDYYWLFYADKPNDINETNENNNIAYQKFHVKKTDIDLLLSNDSISKDTVQTGEHIATHVKISNSGTYQTPDFDVSVYLSMDTVYQVTDYYLNNTNMSYLDGGSTVNASTSFTVPTLDTGNYYLIHVADDNDDVTETNENNNTIYTPIRITSGDIDLSVINSSISSGSGNAGDDITVNADVINIGTEDVPFSSSFGVYLSTDSTYDNNDYELLTSGIDSLQSGSFINQDTIVTLPSNISSGDYYIILAADAGYSLTETNEGNNTSVHSIAVSSAVTSLCDLVIRDSTIASDTIATGQELYVTNEVYNKGNASNSSTVYVGYYLSRDTIWDKSDYYLSSDYVASSSGLAPNFSRNEAEYLTIPSILKEKTYYILFVADHSQNNDEIDEGNNVSYIPVYVKKYEPKNYDLELTNVSISDDTIYAGEYVTLSFYNRNNGTEKITTNFYTRICMSGDSVYGNDYNHTNMYISHDIDPGDSLETIKGFNYPELNEGKHYLVLNTDVYQYIDESKEQNNLYFIPMWIKPSNVDVVPQNVILSDTTCFSSQTINIECQVKNIGTTPCGTSYLYYYLSKDNTLDDFDYQIGYDFISSLDSNEYSAKSINFDLGNEFSTGMYYIIVKADNNDALSEINEDNNTHSIRITVNPTPTPASPVVTDVRHCGPGRVTLTATGADNTDDYRWFTSTYTYLSGEDSSHFTTAELPRTKDFYVCIDSAGFRSDTVKVTAYIDEMPASDTFSLLYGNTFRANHHSSIAVYQWMLDGSDIPGETTRLFNTTNEGSGNISVKINEGACSVVSGSYYHDVLPGPSNDPVVTGDSRCGSGTVTLSASGALGSSTYQWFNSDNELDKIAGETSSTYTRELTNSKSFWVAIDTVSGVYSNLVEVTATIHPEPVSEFSVDTSTQTLSVTSYSAGNTYQWQLEQSDITGANGEDYHYTVSGTYSLVVSNGFCSNTSSQHVIVSSIEENELAEGFSVYPNPTEAEITIQLNNAPDQQVRIAVVNMLGVTCMAKEYEAVDAPVFIQPLDLSTLPSGMYTIKINTGKHIYTRLINKKK